MMANKKLILGIAAGAAVLAGAAVIVARKKSHKKYRAQVEEAKENFKGKLNELQRKAQKEFKNTSSDAKGAVNSAKDRAAEWAGKATNA
jgi:gas vesicle protein